MTMLSQSFPVRNVILASLASDEFETIRPHLRRVDLKRGQVLQESRHKIAKLHFIETGVAIILARTRRDGLVGVGLVGRLGFVGVPVVLGTIFSINRCIVEVPGEAYQLDANDALAAMEACGGIRQRLMNYVQALLVQNSQTALCNARHELDQRLARWLLLAQDRLEGNVIPMTHDLFSMALGVRRAGVTTAFSKFESEGAIRKARGAIEIVDRTQLIEKSCECYRVIADEYDRLVRRARSRGFSTPVA
jgi:CRP-like cAMP-binding protein